MSNKPIHRITIIGTGVIGASWTALFWQKAWRLWRRMSRRMQKPR
jgi:hypothetical protein